MRYKPSKPVAVLGILVGIGMLVFGLINLPQQTGSGRAFLVFWCLTIIGITIVSTWAAFSKRGALGTLMTIDRDDPT